MSARFGRLALPFLAAALAAQVVTLGPGGFSVPQPAAMPSGPPQKPGSIEGAVVDSLTHAGVRKAAVTVTSIKSGYSFVGVSDESGKFAISTVDPDSYYIQNVQVQGYQFDRPLRTGGADGPIVVAENQAVTGVKVEITPFGLIGGKVVDDDGEPMRDVEVQALTYDYSRGARRFSTAGGGTTDDRGQFRLIDLRPGRYFVLAVVPQQQPSQGRVVMEPQLPNTHRTFPELGYAPTLFPNAALVYE